MDFKVNALALKSVDYKDNDVMLTLYSLERGLVSACVRGVKKAGAKLRFAVQPFCFAEYVINERSARNTITSANEIESFYKLRLDITRYYCACCIDEFLLKSGSEEGDEPLFILALSALKELNYGDSNPKAVLCKFLLDGCGLLGYSPSFEYCAICGGEIIQRAFFDFNGGVVVCSKCRTPSHTEIRITTENALRDITFGRESDKIDGDTLNFAIKFCAYYYSRKTGETLKTIDQLLYLESA